MDLPGGIYPNYPGVYFRDEVLAGPTLLIVEISMRGRGCPGAVKAINEKRL